MSKINRVILIDDYIKELKKKKMMFSNFQDAKLKINEIGMYRIKGYFRLFYNKKTDKFNKDTKFEDVLKLYEFDNELSILLIKWLKKIEISLRSFLLNQC